MDDKVLFIRKGRKIKDLTNGETMTFQFINEAKRHVRLKLIPEFGLGSVRVEK